MNQPEGEDSDQVRDQVMDVVRAHFRPEFLNRVDEIILFHRLKRNQMRAIVDIQMVRLQKLLADRNITLELSDDAKEWLGNKGYDPAYGARPLKRVIQKYVQDPMAELLLEGKVHDGDTVDVTTRDGGLVFNGEAVRAAA
ncbi:Chaperone protein ClpB [Methyloligella halotolerans]|uniref:Chaperone protein ClpB n=1 Tax=Methyloligella halotolerans TaxID=1177755 RepID=A0A1E2RYQ7_9HYPH|nr:Chaperone protein ClpB [Methyloligella halotolerans]